MFSLTKVPGNTALTLTGLSITPIIGAVKDSHERASSHEAEALLSLTPPTESPGWIDWMLSGYLGDFLCWSGKKLADICKDACPNLSDVERLREMHVNKKELEQFLSVELLGEDVHAGISQALNSYLRNGRVLIRTEKLNLEGWQQELISLKEFSEFTGNENVAEIFSEWITQLDLLLKKKKSNQQEYQTNLESSECVSKPEKTIKVEHISQVSFFGAIPTVSSVSKEKETALKTNQYLLAATAQLELQNQLTQACYDADIDKVRYLIEKRFADPFTADKDGLQPMAAAIWGLSLEVMDYLETKAVLSLSDWVSIAEFLQNKYGQVIVSVPTEKKGDVIGKCSNWGCDRQEVVTEIRIADALWVNSDEAIKRRGCQVALNQRLKQILDREHNLMKMYPAPWDYNQQRNRMVKDRAQVISEFTPWFNELRSIMINRLKDKEVVISEDNKLITLSKITQKAS